MKLDIDNLHHAYLIEGEYKSVFPRLLEYLIKNKLISGQNDVYQNTSETLNIELSRLIKSQQTEKSNHKIFILGANFFGREAVNSLLKVFEEPTPGTHFFLITPNPHLLPATLRSRLSKLTNDDKNEIKPEVLKQAKEFLSSSKGQRITLIKDFVEQFKDLEAEENNIKSSALELLNGIETIFYQSFRGPSPGSSFGGRTPLSLVYEFEELAKVRDYISDRGSAVKMLLEHVALILPVTK
jgi:hypothetical protein